MLTEAVPKWAGVENALAMRGCAVCGGKVNPFCGQYIFAMLTTRTGVENWLMKMGRAVCGGKDPVGCEEML